MFIENKAFNGGINNLVAPHHIGANQGVYISNAEIQNGEIVSAKDKKTNAETLTGNSVIYYKAQDEVVSSAEDRFYVEWAGFLYWSNSAGNLKRYDGTTVVDVGSHTPPASAPTVTASFASGLLKGSYFYTVTYMHNDFFESTPCDYVAVSPSNQQVDITFTDTPPATATHRRIYRSGGLNPTFNLVVTLPIATGAYTDNIHDFNVSTSELSTNNNDAPPPNLDMLVEKKGTLFGAVDNLVYFSRQGQPEYWSAYDFLQFPKDIMGMGVVGNNVIAFTDDSMYSISGESIQTISVSKLPFNYGCKNKRTVQNIDGRLIWVSSLDRNDAICLFDGASVQIINKLDKHINASTIGSLQYDSFTTETYDSFSFDINRAIVSNHKYYLFMDGRTAIVDFEDSMKIYYMSEAVDTAYSKNNSLFVAVSNTVYEYLPSFGAYRNVIYRTGDFDNGDLTQSKNYRYIKVNGTGTYKITVFIDDKHIMDFETEKSFLPSDAYGKRISFLIESTGYAKIRSISYEYTHLKD